MPFFDPDAAATAGLHTELYVLRPLRAADAAIEKPAGYTVLG